MSRRRQKSPKGHRSLHERARATRDLGLERAARGTDSSWGAQFLKAIYKTATTLQEFISDDVWRIGGVFPTRENRAAGPIFRDAVSKGWMVKTDRMRPSVRSNLSGKPVWRSLLYRSMPISLGEDSRS
jgi:hypothetical protein